MADDLELTARRRRLAPEARREQIVDAAVCYFAEVGLAGTTRDLAKRAGITQALLYQYFRSKADLLEAVFARVYLDRMAPHWPAVLTDRCRPLRERMLSFYAEYTAAIFTYEWMRIFMAAGLAGEALNRRYLEHVRDVLLAPLMDEVRAAARGAAQPDMEDLWNLHGSIVYLGIRRHIYHLPTPDDVMPVIERAIDRFLAGFAIGGAP
ncbi:TetR/AcrR family transcriptional regulator [Phreatobacter cathodiphilus]|uniref:TetR/AcrR family transcriptional regulator n=2 Tax=Phreatobacter cathodiphilus TaxID=1868589 RepID=A0A2S0ND53_9HYPH|nr:TetR/AcrR family transcriptional regulator [Phreatobacter cathodiphilus]